MKISSFNYPHGNKYRAWLHYRIGDKSFDLICRSALTKRGALAKIGLAVPLRVARKHA